MKDEVKFQKLLEPYHIGGVRTRNRIIKTGSGTGFSGDTGLVTEKHKVYYEALARGGVGLIILRLGSITKEDEKVNYPSKAPRALSLGNDKYIPSLRELTQTIHKHGCPTFVQFLHIGAWDLLGSGLIRPVSASALTRKELPGPQFAEAREATFNDIEELVDEFASAAVRAQKAGFDGVEINADTCHLINSFLSRFWNRRQDKYGCQNLENRARFLVEIIQETKNRTGKEYPLIALITGAEYNLNQGLTIQETQGIAQILENAGADAIHIRPYGYGDYLGLHFPEHIYFPEAPKILPQGLDWSRKGAGAAVPLAAAIKKVVSIPVITVGRLDPALGEKVLREGKADFIGMTRPLMADPELPNKLAAGTPGDIAPCTACLCCSTARIQGLSIRCRVNAALGGEQDYYLRKAENKKRVVVVGGGPGGMEAARVAALRGHQVILFEKEHRLGGLLPLAAMVKGMEIEDLPALIRYLKRQIIKLGVDIRLGQEFTPETVQQVKPDVVILATGGLQTIPDIPGIDKHNVITGDELHRKVKPYLRIFGPRILRWLTRFWLPVGKRVIIIGGQLQGCEVAELLVKRGRTITIVDEADKLGDGIVEEYKELFFEWLAKKGANAMAGVKYNEINEKGMSIINKAQKKLNIEADTILTAMPFKPDLDMISKLTKIVPEIHAIGDCYNPCLMIDAIADGYRIARNL